MVIGLISPSKIGPCLTECKTLSDPRLLFFLQGNLCYLFTFFKTSCFPLTGPYALIAEIILLFFCWSHKVTRRGNCEIVDPVPIHHCNKLHNRQIYITSNCLFHIWSQRKILPLLSSTLAISVGKITSHWLMVSFLGMVPSNAWPWANADSWAPEFLVFPAKISALSKHKKLPQDHAVKINNSSKHVKDFRKYQLSH